jgi:hypothetical protein
MRADLNEITCKVERSITDVSTGQGLLMFVWKCSSQESETIFQVFRGHVFSSDEFSSQFSLCYARTSVYVTNAGTVAGLVGQERQTSFSNESVDPIVVCFNSMQ